jgi:hypothetical protein
MSVRAGRPSPRARCLGTGGSVERGGIVRVGNRVEVGEPVSGRSVSEVGDDKGN